MDLSKHTDEELRQKLVDLGADLSMSTDWDSWQIIYWHKAVIETEIECRANRNRDVWTCYRCRRTFPDRPYGEQPYGPEIATNPDTGLKTIVGHVCHNCHDEEAA